MGMDINFMVVSQDDNQILELRDYIQELYGRDYECDYEHRMCGYNMNIHYKDGYTILTGCHRNCMCYELGYWCKRDHKEYLLDNVWYLEDREDDPYIYYCFTMDGDKDGPIQHIDAIMETCVGDLCSSACNFPEGLVTSTLFYFRTLEWGEK